MPCPVAGRTWFHLRLRFNAVATRPETRAPVPSQARDRRSSPLRLLFRVPANRLARECSPPLRPQCLRRPWFRMKGAPLAAACIPCPARGRMSYRPLHRYKLREAQAPDPARALCPVRVRRWSRRLRPFKGQATPLESVSPEWLPRGRFLRRPPSWAPAAPWEPPAWVRFPAQAPTSSRLLPPSSGQAAPELAAA